MRAEVGSQQQEGRNSAEAQPQGTTCVPVARRTATRALEAQEQALGAERKFVRGSVNLEISSRENKKTKRWMGNGKENVSIGPGNLTFK